MGNPEFLYHGSLYKQKELMSGFKRSGQLSVWDDVESNLNLYATTSKTQSYDCLLKKVINMSISDVVFEAAEKSGISLEHTSKEEPILKIRSIKENYGWDIILYYPGKVTKTVKLQSNGATESDASKFIEYVFGDVKFAKEVVRNAEGIVIIE